MVWNRMEWNGMKWEWNKFRIGIVLQQFSIKFRMGVCPGYCCGSPWPWGLAKASQQHPQKTIERVGFSHYNFDLLSLKCHNSQTSVLIFMRLVSVACIFEALHDTYQKIKNRSRKSQVMGCRRVLQFFCAALQKMIKKGIKMILINS